MKDLGQFDSGTWDTEIVDKLKPDETKHEIVIDKTRNTRFWKTILQEKLVELNSDQLIVTGVGANVCVESTVRDARTNSIRAVSDGTAILSDESHQASLKNMRWFGEVATADELVAALKSSGSMAEKNRIEAKAKLKCIIIETELD